MLAIMIDFRVETIIGDGILELQNLRVEIKIVHVTMNFFETTIFGIEKWKLLCV